MMSGPCTELTKISPAKQISLQLAFTFPEEDECNRCKTNTFEYKKTNQSKPAAFQFGDCWYPCIKDQVHSLAIPLSKEENSPPSVLLMQERLFHQIVLQENTKIHYRKQYGST